MKRDTIKWRFFKYNIIVIIMLITFTTIIFNACVHIYIEKNIVEQLNKIASNVEDTALKHGPDFFPDLPPKPHYGEEDKVIPPIDPQEDNGLFRYYFMLDHSLKNPLTLLNADFILLDQNENKITPFPDKPDFTPADLMKQVISEINDSKKINQEKYLNLHLSSAEYIAIIKPVFDKNSFGLGWIIIYSNIQKINQLKLGINIMLFLILVFSALITIIFSSRVSKKISEPFFLLNQYISAISERNFGNKIEMPVYDELREFVNNINVMSEKLETYDKAQKTFLQNVSHEFRTPLMSIQSYAEGIKYDVIDSNSAVEVILAEIKRMTHLVEDLLYLSRLDSIEENYNYTNLDFNKLLNNCLQRMSLLAQKDNIHITTNLPQKITLIHGDEEKLSRAIDNIISNCIRYADNIVAVELKIIDTNKVNLIISDDGPGFKDSELPNIFERFYKGTKGNCGLGLSISKNIIEKLNGKIHAKNSNSGALFIIELPIANNIN
jgi:two-component system sensor histidine kinase CssS